MNYDSGMRENLFCPFLLIPHKLGLVHLFGTTRGIYRELVIVKEREEKKPITRQDATPQPLDFKVVLQPLPLRVINIKFSFWVIEHLCTKIKLAAWFLTVQIICIKSNFYAELSYQLIIRTIIVYKIVHWDIQLFNLTSQTMEKTVASCFLVGSSFLSFFLSTKIKTQFCCLESFSKAASARLSASPHPRLNPLLTSPLFSSEGINQDIFVRVE